VKKRLKPLLDEAKRVLDERDLKNATTSAQIVKLFKKDKVSFSVANPALMCMPFLRFGWFAAAQDSS